MHEEFTPPRKSRLPMILGGCLGCFGLFVVVAGILFFLNRDRVTSAFHTVKTNVEDTMVVRSSLKKEYPGTSPEVQMVKELGGGWGLDVEIPGVEFGDLEEGDKAREIATFAARAHPHPEKIDEVEVRFSNSTGGIVQFRASSSYTFPIDQLIELPPDPPEPR